MITRKRNAVKDTNDFHVNANHASTQAQAADNLAVKSDDIAGAMIASMRDLSLNVQKTAEAVKHV